MVTSEPHNYEFEIKIFYKTQLSYVRHSQNLELCQARDIYNIFVLFFSFRQLNTYKRIIYEILL